MLVINLDRLKERERNNELYALLTSMKFVDQRDVMTNTKLH